MGFIFGKGSYLRHPMNIYEFLVALSGIFDFIKIAENTSLINVVSIFR